MTTYATLQDIIERAGERETLNVADRDGDGVADANVVAAAIEQASRKIDSFLAVRYSLPLAPVPEIVRGWAVSIARYTLHQDGAPEWVVRDWKQALAELGLAGDGRMAVPGASGLAPERSPDGAAMAEGPEPVFSRQNLEGWL